MPACGMWLHNHSWLSWIFIRYANSYDAFSWLSQRSARVNGPLLNLFVFGASRGDRFHHCCGAEAADSWHWTTGNVSLGGLGAKYWLGILLIMKVSSSNRRCGWPHYIDEDKLCVSYLQPVHKIQQWMCHWFTQTQAIKRLLGTGSSSSYCYAQEMSLILPNVSITTSGPTILIAVARINQSIKSNQSIQIIFRWPPIAIEAQR